MPAPADGAADGAGCAGVGAEAAEPLLFNFSSMSLNFFLFFGASASSGGARSIVVVGEWQ